MTLESLINPLKAERKPWDMFFIGLAYSSLAVLLTLLIFEDEKSWALVFLTVLAAIPIMYNTLKLEERKDIKFSRESKLLKEHSKAISFFMFLFIGILISFVLWYVFLPPNVTQELFFSQHQAINKINQIVTSGFSSPATFLLILMNNLRVLFFCLLFAFFYGAGAIFILTWNASVIAAAIGNFFRTNLENIIRTTGSATISTYFHVASLSLMRYSFHAVPEIIGYFFGGLAGGIISVAVIRHDFRTKQFQKIVLDSSSLILLAIAFLVVAAFIEVFITPMLF